LPTAASPIDAKQPHCEQSGLPPNWQGVILLFRSAEIVWVVCAKNARFQGVMQRAMFIHERKHALHQILTAFVLELPQIQPSYVSIFICVTSGAAQRTLPRDLNRKETAFCRSGRSSKPE
jgi:hypothetical protein